MTGSEANFDLVFARFDKQMLFSRHIVYLKKLPENLEIN